MLAALRQRVTHTGLQGPAYAGWRGIVRLLRERYVIRTEVVSVATPATVRAQPLEEHPSLRLVVVSAYDELEPYRDTLDAAYYPGFAARWRAPFSWGETLVMALHDDTVTGFTWVQRGTAEGFPCYYGPLLTGEARLLRAGVLPAQRGRGAYAQLNRAVLSQLFAEGIARVYIDCYRANLPALKSHLRSGFRPIGLLTVVPGRPGRPFVCWRQVTGTQLAP